jgi:CRP-like cAMP-binding protein
VSLQTAEMINGLSKIDQARLFGQLEQIKYRRGVLIFQEGDEGDSLFIIGKGEVEIYKESQGGRQSLTKLVAGEIFGEMSLITAKPRSASCMTLSDATLYKLDTQTFQELVQKDNTITLYLLRVLCERLGWTNVSVQQTKERELSDTIRILEKLPKPHRRALILSTLLPVINQDFLKEYFNLEKPINEGNEHVSTLFQEGEPAFIPSVRHSIKKSLLPALPASDLEAFLLAASAFLFNIRQYLLAISTLTENDMWVHAIKLVKKIRKDTSLTYETQVELMEKFSCCPLSILKEHFSFFMMFIKEMKTAQPELAFRLIEEITEDLPHVSRQQLMEIYRIASVCCDQLGLQNKAIEYLNLANNMTPSSSGSSQQENRRKVRNYILTKRNLESAWNIDKARRSRQLYGRNTIASAFAVSISCLFIWFFGFFLEPFENTSHEVMLFIGITLAAVTFWIIDLIPDYLVGLLMAMGWVLGDISTTSIALSGFSNPSWLFMVFIFGLSVALSKSGLLYRLSLLTLKIFPKNYAGQMAGIAASGFLLNPLIPSSVAKAAISAPIAESISEAMGFEKNSKGAAGIGLAAMIFYGFLFPFFLTSSFLNVLAIELFPGGAS